MPATPRRREYANPIRADAKSMQRKKFSDPQNPCPVCGCEERYTINNQCVDCLIARGKARYASFTPEQREAQAIKDQARYQRRLLQNREPGHDR